LKEVRIGYQKTGVLVIARQQGVLEQRFAKYGTAVKWIEFTSGPPLLEAMNVGSVDVGATGDSPPIFAQSAGAAIVYVAGGPINNGQSIIVQPQSPIRSLADLRAKRIGFTKGSSAHNITIAALEKAGLAYTEVTPVHLSPADAAAAFARSSIDAWAIWDPFLAIAEKTQGARVLVNAADVAKTYSFYLASRAFAAKYPKALGEVLAGLGCPMLELLQHHGVADCPHQFLGLFHRTAHPLARGRQHQLGAEQLEHLAPLHGHGFRHHQDQPIAA